MRPTSVCHPNISTTSTRTRRFPVRPPHLHMARNGGLWGPPRGRGNDAFHDARFASVGCIAIASYRGCSPRWGRCRLPLTSVSLSRASFRWACRAFALSLLGESCQDSFYRRAVKQRWFSESRMPFIDKGHFASAARSRTFTFVRSTGAQLRYPWPPCRERPFWIALMHVGSTNTDLGTRGDGSTPPRLAPRDLASPSAPASVPISWLTERSTPWTRPPFTSPSILRSIRLWSGGSASMRPTRVACRLLQLESRRTSTNSKRLILVARRGPQPSPRLVRAAIPPCGWAPRATSHRTLKRFPGRRFPPVKGLATTAKSPHPPRRRLATATTGGPGIDGPRD